MSLCIYHTIKKVVALLIYANMNIMINEPDKGQNTIKLYIVIQPTFLFLSYFSSDCQQPHGTIISTSTSVCYVSPVLLVTSCDLMDLESF